MLNGWSIARGWGWSIGGGWVRARYTSKWSIYNLRECVVCVSYTQSCPTHWDPRDPRGSSVHRILQARILEWVAISFSRRSSGPRDQTLVSHIPGRLFTIWVTGEVIAAIGPLKALKGPAVKKGDQLCLSGLRQPGHSFPVQAHLLFNDLNRHEDLKYYPGESGFFMVVLFVMDILSINWINQPSARWCLTPLSWVFLNQSPCLFSDPRGWPCSRSFFCFQEPASSQAFQLWNILYLGFPL